MSGYRKKLLAAGCSWTDQNYQHQVGGWHYKTPWPSILGELLGGWRVKNVGESGASNESIARMVIHQINKYEDIDFVVVMWTNWDRFRFGTTDVQPYMVNDNIEKVPHSEIPVLMAQQAGAASDYLKYWVRPEDTVERSMYAMYTTALALQMKEIPFIFCQGLRAFIKRPKGVKLRENKHLLDRIAAVRQVSYYDELDIPECLGYPFHTKLNGHCMMDLLRDRFDKVEDFAIHPTDIHPNDKAHRCMAEHIYKYMKEINHVHSSNTVLPSRRTP